MTDPNIEKLTATESKVKAFFLAHRTWIIAAVCFVAGLFVGHYR